MTTRKTNVPARALLPPNASTAVSNTVDAADPNEPMEATSAASPQTGVPDQVWGRLSVSTSPCAIFPGPNAKANSSVAGPSA